MQIVFFCAGFCDRYWLSYGDFKRNSCYVHVHTHGMYLLHIAEAVLPEQVLWLGCVCAYIHINAYK